MQLGRPYVLYPLCAAILLGALWFSFGNPLGSGEDTATAEKHEAKNDVPKATVPALIPVTFKIEPDGKGLEVITGGIRVPANPEGKFAFPAGHYSLTLNKEGFIQSRATWMFRPQVIRSM